MSIDSIGAPKGYNPTRTAYLISEVIDPDDNDDREWPPAERLTRSIGEAMDCVRRWLEGVDANLPVCEALTVRTMDVPLEVWRTL